MRLATVSIVPPQGTMITGGRCGDKIGFGNRLRASVEGPMRPLNIGLGLGHDVLKLYVIMSVQCLVGFLVRTV